jgi:16S rRNA (guanine966-N2)-methyltransferase
MDMFAGSGALGLEAASRGAGRVLMLDSSPVVVEQLRQNISLLRLEQTQVQQADALAWLQGEPQQFDILFLDPPFAANLLQELCDRLEQGGWLGPDAWIYLEMDADSGRPLLPATWHVLKEKKAGQVEYLLCSRK